MEYVISSLCAFVGSRACFVVCVLFTCAEWALEAFTAGWRKDEGLELDQPQQREGDGEGWGEGEGVVDRRLEFCEDGFWLITPRGGGFPFYGVRFPLV